ncbi:hypothetical protein V7O66_03390 [Methanolobus sp. ZRKC3]|uniref:hypothetical protein n=1 Tax=Methanolobus sp. ZRKC3 TaxID=3125786 RepID=UPI00325134D3
MTDESKIDAALDKSVSKYSADAQKNRAIGELVTSKEDSMFDLTEPQIATVALFRAFDKSVVEIPGMMSFFENYASLSRSKERAGRYEYAASHAQKLLSYVKSLPQTSPDMGQPEPQNTQKKGALSWLWGSR